MRRAWLMAGLLLLIPVPVWSDTAPVPGPLVANEHYAIIPDQRFIWHGPQAALGIVVWGHGLDEHRRDLRGQAPPAFLRPLNKAGYDVVRFDRDPSWDGNTRIPDVVAFLRDGLVELRNRGWKRIVAGGQSRGGINVLSLLKTPGAADVILTTSAAMAGTDPGSVAMRGEVNLYDLLHDTPKQNVRVMYIQFLDDPFAGDEEKRANRVREWVGPKVSALLVLDRPEGFHGHIAGASADFAEKYRACITSFVMDEVPPKAC